MPIVCIFKHKISQTHSKNMFANEWCPLYVHLYMPRLQLDIS